MSREERDVDERENGLIIVKAIIITIKRVWSVRNALGARSLTSLLARSHSILNTRETREERADEENISKLRKKWDLSLVRTRVDWVQVATSGKVRRRERLRGDKRAREIHTHG